MTPKIFNFSFTHSNIKTIATNFSQVSRKSRFLELGNPRKPELFLNNFTMTKLCCVQNWISYFLTTTVKNI